MHKSKIRWGKKKKKSDLEKTAQDTSSALS